MSSIIIETPPAVEPVTLAELKADLHLGPFEDSDHVSSAILATRLRNLLIAAREWCEMFTRRSFIQKGYVQNLDSFPYYTDTLQSQQAYPPAYYSLPRYSTTLWNYSQMIKLFYSPLIAVHHITYYDSATARPKALVLGYAPWFPFTSYIGGAKITDSLGNVQTCTAAGTTGQSEPAWPALAGATTTDGTITWTAAGTAAPSSDYVVDTAAEPPRVFPRPGQYWPSVLYIPNAVQIHFTAGYGLAATDVPATAKVAIRRLAAFWDANPEAPVPESIKALLWSIRVLDVAPTRG